MLRQSTLKLLGSQFNQRSLRLASNSMSSNSMVLTKVDESTGYARVTLNREPVNGLNLEMLTCITDTIRNLEQSKVRGMILSSTFTNKVFCAGLDISEMINPNPERLRTFWMALQNMWMKLYGSTMHTAAIINGHSPAGGCLLAMACDYRIMFPNFTIGLNENALGIVVPAWLQLNMQEIIGPRRRALACDTAKLFNTQEAFEINLIDEIAHSMEDADRKAVSYLNIFQTMPDFARTNTKLQLRNRVIDDFQNYRDQDTQRFMKNVMNPAFQNGLAAFMEALRQRSSQKNYN
ncbi:enoyl-CoA delta isomerase 1, mitochondrial-like [Uranotaenia lowii]|uniref:enoyl-CoA delta isomerase 1, mitochondrial-like n=1 Tax=Uranotaenia lowii TaxID=190385 RepID=UPI00247894AE|nr:enoyl-CoA delta isomerase 1, mitochondrial-like [Uranotaenia lowii]